MRPMSHIPFNRSGIAALSDLDTEIARELYAKLDKEQAAFLAREDRFRSREYQWPKDPLHTWSRVWEYPYVYFHIKSWLDEHAGAGAMRVVDFGSGVTFFPFSVARLGCQVTCIDTDLVAERDMARAAAVTPCDPGAVEFLRYDGEKWPLGDSAIDVIYCISVLEHMASHEATIREMSRVLKPDGVLLLTIDLDLRGDSDIGADGFSALRTSLLRYFDLLRPETTVHPMDMLRSDNGPYGFKELKGAAWLKFYLSQHLLKPLFLKKPRMFPPFLLAVNGMVLKKRSMNFS